MSAGEESKTVIRISSRLGRRVGVATAGFALLVTTACGFNAQTLKQYTPAEGVNINVGMGSDQEPVVLVRGLMVISRTPGSGFLSASLQTSGSDQLTGVSGVVIKTDGTQGAPITASLPAPVPFVGNKLVVLTDGAEIPITSPDLIPGGDVKMTLTFASGGSATTLVPIVNGNFPNYETVSPSPEPSSSPS